MQYSLRDATEDDARFLFELYASTREAELAPVPWSQEQKRAFLWQQSEAQHAHYRQHYPLAEYFVIQSGSERAGRLYVSRGSTEIRIMDIALVPEFRGRGLGTAVVQSLLDEAKSTERTVGIHVEKNNPAYRLYTQLGFEKSEDRGVYDFLIWTPDQLKTASYSGPS